MPVSIDLFNLIIPKQVIAKKYTSVDQFRLDFEIEKVGRHQEDDELFSLASMNFPEFHIEELVIRGFEFREEPMFSNDFTVIARYGGIFWEVDWLNHNAMFAWHNDCLQWQKEKAKEISSLTMDKIAEMQENGEDPFGVIWGGKK